MHTGKITPVRPPSVVSHPRQAAPDHAPKKPGDWVAPTAPCHAPVWEGPCIKKPWEYKVTAVIPHLETPEILPACIQLLRLQSEPAYVLVIDTGSTPATCAELEKLRGEGVEIHYLRTHGYQNSSEGVAFAQDVAMTLCRTEYLFNTHADCFLRRRDFLSYLTAITTAIRPVVGYQMSSRHWLTEEWVGMVSHTATMLHMPTMRRHGINWNMQKAYENPDHHFERGGAAWPDTETGFGYCLDAAGIKPYLIGSELNYVRQTDENIDHVRSYPGSKLFGADHHDKAKVWMQDALKDANERIEQWTRLQTT